MEAVDTLIGWRGTFLVLSVMSVAASVTAFVLVPRHTETEKPRVGLPALNVFLGTMTDGRFLRIAPLSASVVGTAVAVHGLWAARWLAEVNHFAPLEVLHALLAMGAGLTVGALAIGATAIWLARIGISGTKAFGGFCAASMVLQAAILIDVPLSPKIMWGTVGAFSGIGVLSYSILDGVFPISLVGRANSALNVLHLTTAWLVQSGMGLVIGQWTTDRHGHYPVAAYRAAFTVPLIVQLGAMLWFVMTSWLGEAGQREPPTVKQTAETDAAYSYLDLE
jgi:predicted MFS family arabinose efflux permease